MPFALVLMCARLGRSAIIGRSANIGLTAAVATFRTVPAAAALKVPLARASTGMKTGRLQLISPAVAAAAVVPLSPPAAAVRGTPFALTNAFVNFYRRKRPPFGYNGLGKLIYEMHYARTVRGDGRREQWADTMRRVVEGCFTLPKGHLLAEKQLWDEQQAQVDAKEMFDRMFCIKMLPAGRALTHLSPKLAAQQQHDHSTSCVVDCDLGNGASVLNCIFLTTANMDKDKVESLVKLFDATLQGVGPGFDTLGAGSLHIRGHDCSKGPLRHVVRSSRAGYVCALRLLLHSFIDGTAQLELDYSHLPSDCDPSLLRPVAGVTSALLQEMLGSVRELLIRRAGSALTVTDIVDVANFIGRCVSGGGVRRCAEIALGQPDSIEFLDLKDYQLNSQRMAWGWASNNSVCATVGMDYKVVCERIKKNGEPGIAWLDNMRRFGRLNGKDIRPDLLVVGGNPCLEMSLEDHELCSLVEVFLNRHTDLPDFLATLRSAVLFCKSLTLVRTHWPESDAVTARNRRMGVSVSGVAQFLAKHGEMELVRWLEAGYGEVQQLDAQYSAWLRVPQSIKTTCVKPSGTVSLLAGATPGAHFPISRFYIRRVRTDSLQAAKFRALGYPTEPEAASGAGAQQSSRWVVEIPVDCGYTGDCGSDVSMVQQLELAALLQRHWADNQVSCTVTFDPLTEGPQLPAALERFETQLKGVSFLPRCSGAYKQMPYEEISEAEYKRRLANIRAE